VQNSQPNDAVVFDSRSVPAQQYDLVSFYGENCCDKAREVRSCKKVKEVKTHMEVELLRWW